MEIMREVDALQESQAMLKMYETKYGIKSECVERGEFDATLVTAEDQIYWNFFIKCFKLNGGTFDGNCKDTKETEIEELDDAKETISQNKNNDLILKQDKNKGRDAKSLPFSLLQWFANDFMNSKISTKNFASNCRGN